MILQFFNTYLCNINHKGALSPCGEICTVALKWNFSYRRSYSCILVYMCVFGPPGSLCQAHLTGILITQVVFHYSGRGSTPGWKPSPSALPLHQGYIITSSISITSTLMLYNHPLPQLKVYRANTAISNLWLPLCCVSIKWLNRFFTNTFHILMIVKCSSQSLVISWLPWRHIQCGGNITGWTGGPGNWLKSPCSVPPNRAPVFPLHRETHPTSAPFILVPKVPPGGPWVPPWGNTMLYSNLGMDDFYLAIAAVLVVSNKWVCL